MASNGNGSKVNLLLTLGLALAAAVGGWYSRDITRFEDKHTDADARYVAQLQAETTAAHALGALEEAVRNLQKRDADLDEALQREMDLKAARLLAEIAALGGQIDTLNAEIIDARADIERLRDAKDQALQDNARQDAHIETLRLTLLRLLSP